jgi:tetratricopeptide (TPR) repeat protein
MKPAILLLLLASVAIALVPGDLHNDDVLVAALYHTEPFQGINAHVPNTLEDAKSRLEAQIAATPEKVELYQALSEIDSRRGDFTAAEKDLTTYVQKATDKGEAYSKLEKFYADRLRFDDQLTALQQHAAALTVKKQDVTDNQGRYALYKKISEHISHYRLSADPSQPYLSAIRDYPDQLQPYLDYINYLKINDHKAALEAVEKIKSSFPDATGTYLLTKASLLSDDEAFDLLNESFDPLWDEKLIRAFDSHLIATGHKRDYLNVLKEKLQKNPLDADAATRLFHVYHLSGNLMEAQNALNDFRLLKEQKVREKQTSWSAKELLWMAKLNQKLLNYNEAARYYYALFSLLGYKTSTNLSADTALKGLFDILLAAEERPIQLSSGSLDYYKDIASMDQNPGVLNGILSLILNRTDPAGNLQVQQDKAIGYFNRAEALRLVRYTQKLYPKSTYLPAMYRDSLKIFEKYGMDQLIVEAGEEFFHNFPTTPEILDVGVAVTDAYSRLKNHEKEWQTYQFLLPIAADREPAGSLLGKQQKPEPDSESGQDQQTKQSQVNYQLLLNRYIASLTSEKNYLEVVRLYKQEIVRHPDEESLYANFATYLTQNQLFDEEKNLYQQAIDRFQGRGWYEKLARWYLRNKRESEYQLLSQKVMDIFKGTEIEIYLQGTLGGSKSLRFALNLFAHQKFPLNLKFVHNLLDYYSSERQWNDWEALSAEYYFLDDSIREGYLRELSSRNRLQASADSSDAIHIRFSGDVKVWQSHFEEAAVDYKQLEKIYPSDAEINTRLADIQRSLGVQDVQNYFDSAKIREHLASLNPGDSALWTTAGETLADIERYDDSRKYWNEILTIDPYNSDRYIEVATIYWDYYLFDDALSTIAKIRTLQKQDSLFAYEAGAIYESKRDYPKAIDEYAKSLAEQENLAWNRLGQLYGRKKFTELIRKELEAQLQKNPQDERIWTGTIEFYKDQKEKEIVRSLLNRAAENLKPEPFRNLAESLKQTARDMGFADLQVKLINRQYAESSEDLERWNRKLELARLYESTAKAAEAEAIYRELYRQQPHSAGIIQEILSYYWRSEQFNKAFDIYKEALSAANQNWKKRYLLEVAGKYRERKDYSSALLSARELLNGEPLNAQYFQLTAEILAEQKDFAGLSAHYKEGLKRVSESKLSSDEKKQRIAALRRGIIQANIILKDTTAALDQYIEIINRDAENEEGLKEASDFAAKNGLMQRLFDYYAKTAEASPKDHRWPMVLGRLNLYSGNFETAIKQFQIAIQIRPERPDFYQQVAESFQRLGKYEEALVQYQKAYEISYKNGMWLTPMAELHARLGHKKEALQIYGETLKGLTPMYRNFSLCTQSLKWGFTSDAVAYGKAGLDLYYKDMSVSFTQGGFQSYLEALIRSGNGPESFAVIVRASDRISTNLVRATFDTEQLRSAQYMVDQLFGSGYAELLRRYYINEDWEKLHTAIFVQTSQSGMRDRLVANLLSLTRAAQMAPAEERLLQELATFYRTQSKTYNDADWSQYTQYHSQLLSFYTKRQEYLRGAEWMESEYNLSPRRGDYRDDLIRIAHLYKLAEKVEKEIAVLRLYYQYGSHYDLQPQPVERYLDLLYTTNKTEEIKQAAAAATLPAINYFFKKREKGMAVLAIDSFHKRKKNAPSWQTTQLAMLGWQLRDSSDFFDKNFQIALDIRPIGELLKPERDITKTLEGDDSFYYGRKYGEYLFWTQNASASYYLPSDLEGLPTAGTRQDELGSFYLSEKKADSALQHFELSLQLNPDNMQYQDHRNRALIALGKREDAIQGWSKLVQNADDRDKAVAWQLFIQAAADFQFVSDHRKEIESFLTDRISKSGDFSISNLYLQNLPEPNRAELVSQWIPLAPAPMQFGEALLRSNLGFSVDLRIYSMVNNYLESRLLTAVGQEQSSTRSDWWRWNQTYISSLVTQKKYDSALQLVAKASERFESTEERGTKEQILLLKSKILAEAGKPAEALETLKEFMNLYAPEENDDVYQRQERYRRALRTVQGMKEVELPLQEEMYTWLLSKGQTEDANYVGLAEVKIQKGEMPEAKQLLQKMIFLNSENLDGFGSAAELYEKHKHWEEAAPLREDLVKRKPWDTTNRAHLADDLLQLNRKSDAASLAKSVVVTPFAEAEARALAARVYGKSAAGQIGPSEMIAIEQAARGTSVPDPAYYARHLRMTLLNRSDQPAVKLVLAEYFLNPDDSPLRIQLFLAMVREKKCEQALELIDPDLQRDSGYYSESSENEDYEEEEYNDSSYNRAPIETLNLTDPETHDLALDAAGCAAQAKDFTGQIYFLKMASKHSTDNAEITSINEQISKLEKEQTKEEEKASKEYTVGLNVGRANE